MAAPRHAWFWLILGLVALSQSGNIIRLGDAHPVVITFWRLALALLVLLPLGASQARLLGALGRQGWLLLLGAGLALALHWFAWIAAVQRTTVANAAVFFAVNPVFVAAAGYLVFRERVGPKLLCSIGLGIAGVAVMGGASLRFTPHRLQGDLYAILCALLFAVYFLAGKVLRQELPSRIYVTSVYGTAFLVSLAALLLLELPVAEYDGRTWIAFLGMALVPTLLGHTGLNVALRYFDVSRLSVSTLSEPILAGLVAWLAWGEAITPQTVVGYALIVGSVLLLVLDRAPAPDRT